MKENFTLEINNNILTINIFGKIGSSLFEEGFGLKNLQEEVEENKFNKIILNISSLGGNSYEGINCYNYLESLKLSGIEIETNYIGLNASAGTVIGMAGTVRNISETGLFLVHYNRVSVCDSTKDDLISTAEDIGKLDELLENIYLTKISIDRDSLMKIMNADEWMNPKEAESYGFITNILPSTILISNELILEVNNSGLLPNLKNKLENKMINEIKNLLELTDSQDLMLEVKNLLDSKKEYSNKVIEFENKIIEAENKVTEIKNKYDELIIENKKVNIEKILEDAIRKEKITANLKENYQNLLTLNFDETKKLIDKMTPIRTISILNNSTTTDDINKYPNLSYSQISVRDSSYLEDIFKNNFDLFNKIYKEEYKVDYIKS